MNMATFNWRLLFGDNILLDIILNGLALIFILAFTLYTIRLLYIGFKEGYFSLSEDILAIVALTVLGTIYSTISYILFFRFIWLLSL